MKRWTDPTAFVLALLAALCAEAIPLTLGLTLSAVLVMAMPQILNRLGIWTKKRTARCTTTERPKRKTPCRRFIRLYSEASEGVCQV